MRWELMEVAGSGTLGDFGVCESMVRNWIEKYSEGKWSSSMCVYEWLRRQIILQIEKNRQIETEAKDRVIYEKQSADQIPWRQLNSRKQDKSMQNRSQLISEGKWRFILEPTLAHSPANLAMNYFSQQLSHQIQKCRQLSETWITLSQSSRLGPQVQLTCPYFKHLQHRISDAQQILSILNIFFVLSLPLTRNMHSPSWFRQHLMHLGGYTSFLPHSLRMCPNLQHRQHTFFCGQSSISCSSDRHNRHWFCSGHDVLQCPDLLHLKHLILSLKQRQTPSLLFSIGFYSVPGSCLSSVVFCDCSGSMTSAWLATFSNFIWRLQCCVLLKIRLPGMQQVRTGSLLVIYLLIGSQLTVHCRGIGLSVLEPSNSLISQFSIDICSSLLSCRGDSDC